MRSDRPSAHLLLGEIFLFGQGVLTGADIPRGC